MAGRPTGAAAGAGRRRRAVLSPAAARQQRVQAVCRVRALQAESELRIDAIVAELSRHLPVPQALLQVRRRRVARDIAATQRRLDRLCAQVDAQRDALAALMAQDATLAALEQREPDTPYVEGLWTDLRQVFDREGADMAQALARWQQLERRLADA